MGATTFEMTAHGASAQEAFTAAVAEAQDQYGRRGYTGTIAEKDSFVLIPWNKADHGLAEDWAAHLIDHNDPRIDDKWGPAGCIDLGGGCYYFFGWASE